MVGIAGGESHLWERLRECTFVWSPLRVGTPTSAYACMLPPLLKLKRLISSQKIGRRRNASFVSFKRRQGNHSHFILSLHRRDFIRRESMRSAARQWVRHKMVEALGTNVHTYAKKWAHMNAHMKAHMNAHINARTNARMYARAYARTCVHINGGNSSLRNSRARKKRKVHQKKRKGIKWTHYMWNRITGYYLLLTLSHIYFFFWKGGLL